MRRYVTLVAAGCWLAALVGFAAARDAAPSAKAKAEETECGSFGTSIDFEDTPKEAAKKAKQEQKLVFVLHVSGNFEDPRFT